MIDITFLLLIFFLVATRMDPRANIELPKARTGAAVSARNAVVFTVKEVNGHQMVELQDKA